MLDNYDAQEIHAHLSQVEYGQRLIASLIGAATVIIVCLLILLLVNTADAETIVSVSPADLNDDGPELDVAGVLMVRPPIRDNVSAAAQVGATIALPHFRGSAFYRTDALVESGSMGAAGVIDAFAFLAEDGGAIWELGARASGAADDRNPGEWFLGAFASVNGDVENAHGGVWLSAGWTERGIEGFGGFDFYLHPAGSWFRAGFAMFAGGDNAGGIDVWVGASHESISVRVGWLAGAPPHWWGRGTRPAASTLENSVMYVAIEVR